MKILKIALKNLNSLKLDAVIDFTATPLRDAGLFAIVGDTGAGKTTILDAMTLGLYGKVHRNKDEGEVLSYGTVDGHAEVEFLVKEAVYRSKWIVWRSRGKVDGKINTKRELAKWNAKKEIFEIIGDKKREIEEAVEQITGLDYERFKKSVLLSQGDFAAFLKAGDRERSNLLERITGTEVYSQISMAAFQKHKQEEQKITTLKNELDRLQILDPETLADLIKEQKALKKESKVQQKVLQTLQNQIQWRQRLQVLAEQKSQWAEAVAEAKQSITDAQTDFARLERHQQTLVFQKDLTRLESLRAAKEELEVEKKEVATAIQHYQIQKDDLSQKAERVIAQLQIIKTEKANKEQLFEQVKALDVKLEEKQIPRQKIQLDQQEIDSQVADNRAQIAQLEAEKIAKEKLIEDIKEWLVRNENYEKVGTVVPVLENLFAQWETLKIEEQNLTQEVAEQRQSIQKVEQDLAASGQQMAEYDGQLAAANALLAHFESTDTNQILETLNQALEDLDKQATHLVQLIDLNEDYLGLINDLSGYDEEIENLEKQRADIEQRLLTAVEVEDAAQKHYDFKAQMYERERLLANYDRERNNLQKGDKCPLCFSTTHPFREIQDYKPYVNEAETEFLAAEKQLQSVKQSTRQLSGTYNEVNNQIHQIIGEQERNLEGKRDIILKNIKTAEGKIAAIAPELLDENLFHIRKATILKEKLAITQKNIAEKRSQRNELMAMNQQRAQREKQITTLRQLQNQQQVQLANFATSMTNLEKQLAGTQQKKADLAAQVEKLLSPFEYTFQELPTRDILDKLNKKQYDYDKVVQRQRTENEQLVVLQQSLKQAQQQSKELRKRQAKIQKEAQQLQSALDILQKERKVLFGDQIVTVVRHQLENQLAFNESAVETTNQQLKTAEIQLKSEDAKAKKIDKDYAKVVNDLERQAAQLLKKIQPKNFATIDELEAANLTESEVLALENIKGKLEKNLTQSQQSLKNVEQELEKLQTDALTTESLETLLDKKESLAAEAQVLQQQIGKLTQQIEDNDKRKAEGKSLLEKVAIQQKEYRRWAKLKEIIGSADGKVFRAFAQGLTLKKLSELANRHLLQLNGRYLIHKPNDKDLALEIVDQHQANNIRSIHTLSGGESFLVSLALALGLSDLAGRNTQIKSLFIDEGFGTLDESALDLAISTLENLQSKGKRIGVISHVAALKERIATQIQVKKRGSGFSDLEVVN